MQTNTNKSISRSGKEDKTKEETKSRFLKKRESREGRTTSEEKKRLFTITQDVKFTAAAAVVLLLLLLLLVHV